MAFLAYRLKLIKTVKHYLFLNFGGTKKTMQRERQHVLKRLHCAVLLLQSEHCTSLGATHVARTTWWEARRLRTAHRLAKPPFGIGIHTLCVGAPSCWASGLFAVFRPHCGVSTFWGRQVTQCIFFRVPEKPLRAVRAWSLLCVAWARRRGAPRKYVSIIGF